jgi:putative ABC transport system permease protein
MERLGLRNIEIVSRKPPADAVESNEEASSDRDVQQYGVQRVDAERCEAVVPGLVRTAPMRKVRQAVIAGRRVNAEVWAVTPEFFEVQPAEVIAGRKLCALDEHLKRQHVVLEAPVPREITGLRDAMSLQLMIGNLVFDVVGVVRLRGVGFVPPEQNEEPAEGALLRIYMPFETGLGRFGTVTREEADSRQRIDLELDRLILECRDPLKAVKPVQAIMRHGHEKPDYEINVPLDLLHQRQTARRNTNIFLLVAAALTLLVGGVGIMNIMLVSVSERTREIGVRRAIGARRRDIVRQFLIETAALTLLGGIMGCLGGLLGIQITHWMTGWPVATTALALLGCLVLSVAEGLLFGLYPAWRAAQIQPVEALRSD